MENSLEPAIQLSNICYEANDLHILKNISGVFQKGKITTLVGPSGAGKTTLLKMCNGLLSPSSGQITIFGNPIENYAPTELRKLVGIALQAAPMINGTVFDNLSLPRRLQNKDFSYEEAISHLEHVGLDKSLLNRHVTDLSGGQRQKISIARTLINNADILLLDEITSALDPTSRHDIEELIQQINTKYNTTILWITHNIQQAIAVGHYTWVLMDGELIQHGDNSILQHPSNTRVEKFVQGVAE